MKQRLLMALVWLPLHVWSADLVLSGSVISDNEKIITSRFMGFVTQVSVHEGDFVKKGEPLYKIDSKDIDTSKSQVELAVAQAKLSYEMYKNNYENVLLNLKRFRRLLDKDMVSKTEVENLELQEKNLQVMLDIAQKQINQANARLQEVESQYKYLDITAPNNGVIIKKSIKVGEMAMPGMPALVLSDLNDLKILTEVAEKNLRDIYIGQKVDVEIGSINYKTEGHVSSIIPSSNPMTHSFQVKVEFKTRSMIYPGMFATITLH